MRHADENLPRFKVVSSCEPACHVTKNFIGKKKIFFLHGMRTLEDKCLDLLDLFGET